MAGGAKRGRKPKPHALKVIEGTAKGSDPVLELPEATDLEPPTWLREIDNPGIRGTALEEWEKLAPLLSDSRVLTEGDLSQLAHACQLHGEIVSKYRKGLAVTAADRAQLRTAYSEFGLTPASRARVRPQDKDRSENRFGKLSKQA